MKTGLKIKIGDRVSIEAGFANPAGEGIVYSISEDLVWINLEFAITKEGKVFTKGTAWEKFTVSINRVLEVKPLAVRKDID